MKRKGTFLLTPRPIDLPCHAPHAQVPFDSCALGGKHEPFRKPFALDNLGSPKVRKIGASA